MKHEQFAVLAIEDHSEDLILLREALREIEVLFDRQFTLYGVPNLKEGIALLNDKASAIDVVLLDLGLPDTFGMSGLDAILASWPDIPVIVVTGHQDLNTASTAIELGASDFLMKSNVGPEPLFRAISYAIERKKAETLLREENYRFVEAQRVGNVGSWDELVGEDVLRLSEQACTILGLDPTKRNVSSRDYYARIHEEERAAVQTARNALVEDLQSYEIEYRVFQSDGPYKWVRERGQADSRNKSTSKSLLGTIHDITRQKQAEFAKSEFIAIVSHELRTPITSIKASLQLAKTGNFGDIPEPINKLLTIASRSAIRLAALVDDILDVKQLESGKMRFDMASVDLAEVVRDSIERNIPLCADYDISFNVNIPNGSWTVWGDRARLGQVIDNLISNALKFSFKGNQIDIALLREKDALAISIKDYGCGIPASETKTIFEPFSQIENSDVRTKGGTGLGLSIAHTIIERHNGEIEVESELGQGANFTVRLKPY